MPSGIEVVWDNDAHSIIRWDFKPHWTWDEWRACANQALIMRETVLEKPIVPAIFNLRDSGPVPLPMRALPHLRSAAVMMYERDYTVIAHPSGMVRTLADLFFTLYHSYRDRAVLVDTLADARVYIAQREGWLPRAAGQH